jgi:F-type H+-transporting ATPase subunit delta
MHAASRQALAALRERLDAVTPRFSTADGLIGLGEELYAVSAVLVAQPRLRRRLADPTTPGEGRAEFAARLFADKISASAGQLVQDAVALRWSSPWDMLDALESTADDVLFGAAEHDGVIEQVEDELFRFERVLAAESRLATLLDDTTAEVSRRIALVRELVGAKVHPITLILLEHTVASQRATRVTFAIDQLLNLAARRRDRSMARVISAVELTPEQQARLAATLSDLYHRPMDIRTAIDPAVRGGLVIRVGDEVIDGSVAARIATVRKALAG